MACRRADRLCPDRPWQAMTERRGRELQWPISRRMPGARMVSKSRRGTRAHRGLARALQRCSASFDFGVLDAERIQEKVHGFTEAERGNFVDRTGPLVSSRRWRAFAFCPRASGPGEYRPCPGGPKRFREQAPFRATGAGAGPRHDGMRPPPSEDRGRYPSAWCSAPVERRRLRRRVAERRREACSRR